MTKYPFLRLLCLATVCQLFVAGPLDAMPPLQHRVTGTVQRFDPQTRTLIIVPATSEQSSGFLIKEGRTRLRQDGRKATVEQLPADGPVKIYYKTELGQRVATEVSWRSENPKP